MSIENISKNSLNARVANTGRVEANQSQAKAEKGKRPVHTKLDTVDISKEARNLEQTVENLKTVVSEIPDVRDAKVEEVRAKLKDGFYDRQEVIEDVANKVIDAFSIKKQGS
ncbi:MAG TPA: flagellar biosynthesis anti-sigma factor FlgM [Candidatus Wunengus sp. YC60]|uniref:flagellar biosynthesis anti-sigma factor FlgM n=1 Tax=Candidatus Wunengus sp. YC60 TaxID=3367697 RepID=UPI0040287DA8